MKLLRCAPLVVLCLVVAGCSDRPKMAKVRGTVTLDGQPLAKGSVIFEAANARPATGTIVNGEIVTVGTYDTDDGAPVGQHKVAISATEDAGSAGAANPGEASKPGADYMSGKSLIPAMYNDPNSSGLSADIKPGENKVKFELSSKPAN